MPSASEGLSNINSAIIPPSTALQLPPGWSRAGF